MGAATVARVEPHPEIRYVRSGEAEIAYQVWGDGPVDLVYLANWGNLVWNWQLPTYARFLRRLGSFALAGPSEVLVSSTVRDLTVGSGIIHEDRGEHELKGVPDRWRLFAVADAGG